MKSTLIRGRMLAALLGTLALASASQAQSPDADDIQQTVVRVAYLSGEVSYSRGDDPDDWQPASLNFPMTLGDRLYTAGSSRVELQTEGGAIYLAPETDLAALNLTYEVKQFSLGMGSASFRIRHIEPGESFEVDTPNAAVTVDAPGQYRIDVDRDGNTRVLVTRGHAYVAAGGGEVPLEAGRLMAVDGIDSPVYDVTSLPRPDSWDRWVATRSRPPLPTGSLRYVSADISGADDLDQYGRWSQIPEYGSVWSPANVSADWQPYRAGRWAWQDPWGWSWVSTESWGWAPYHYGRWITSGSRWYWVPVGPDVRAVRYAPALVAFVGGPGFSLSVSAGGGGNIGWFPLAPRDPFVPWWGSRARETNRPGVTNVTYVNRTYVTVVNQNTFVSGAPVAKHIIRDAKVVREVSAAPVVHGPLQIVPVASSIRVSEKAGSAPHPLAATQARAVVTRLAPPPAPALFRQKENLIRENRGAPVQAAEAARLAPVSRAIRPTRSVVVESGRINFAPKNAKIAGPAPVPVTREVMPGQAHREAATGARVGPPGGVKGAPTPAQQQGLDARKAQEAEALRLKQQQELEAHKAQTQQQEAESARVKQQQGLDARKAQEAEALRLKQQQGLDARKAQEAEALRLKQQQGLDARKAQEAEALRLKQQQGLDARKAQEAEALRLKQQQGLDARKAQEAEALRLKQQQGLDARKAQEAEALRLKQQQGLDARKAQEAEALRLKQQQGLDARKAQEAEALRLKQQQELEAHKAQKQQVEAESARVKQTTGGQNVQQPKTPDQKKEPEKKGKDKKDQTDEKEKKEKG